MVELPPGLTYVSDDGGGAYDAALGLWTIAGALAPAATRTLHVVVALESAQAVHARATITAASLLDANPANNEATLGVAAMTQADIQLSVVPVAPSSTPIVAGNLATYTVTVTNTGSNHAYSVLVANTIVSGTGAFQPSTASAGIFIAATGQWQIASLAPGVSATLTLTVLAIEAPLLSVQAAASSAVSDPNAGNNVASATVDVVVRTSTVTLTLSPDTVAPAQASPITVTVSDAEASGTASNPAGTVTFSSSVAGDLFASVSCVLAPVLCPCPRRAIDRHVR